MSRAMLIRYGVVALVAATLGFFGGWLAPGEPPGIAPPENLRLPGYQLINPLLACNINNSTVYKENKTLEKELKAAIDAHQISGDISKASVYFTDLTTNTWAEVYGNDTYYPSSLGKIPILIAYYRLSESDPGVLAKEILYPVGSTDLNKMQDIRPAQAIVPGRSYTVEQLMEYMVIYSDNNATALLDANIDSAAISRVYEDLNIPSEANVDLSNADFMMPHQISIVFRVLYNATYLSRSDSEKVLELLSKSGFDQGIVAGVGSSTTVANKLGLVGIAPNGVTTEHELHDCGIVYANDPYVMCVMTRGSAPLPVMEGIISQLSSITYKSVEGQ